MNSGSGDVRRVFDEQPGKPRQPQMNSGSGDVRRCHQMVSSRRNNKANVGKIRCIAGFKPFDNEEICTNYIN